MIFINKDLHILNIFENWILLSKLKILNAFAIYSFFVNLCNKYLDFLWYLKNNLYHIIKYIYLKNLNSDVIFLYKTKNHYKTT